MSGQETHSGTGPGRNIRRGSRSWAFAAVAIVLILVAGYAVIKITRNVLGWPGSVGNGVKDFVADALRPKVHVDEFVALTVTQVQHKSKLVVLTTTINTDVERREGSTSWGVYWGTNTARVHVQDAKVQYCIDLQNLGTADFAFDDAAKVLTVTVPRPRVDEQMVSIDPANIQTIDLSGGWARWDKQETHDRAVAELLPKVIQEAKHHPLLQKEADEAGKEALLGLLNPQAETLRSDGVKIEVRYRD